MKGKVFFDTTVLIAASDGQHPHHPASRPLIAAAAPEANACAAHSLAEVYAVLSRLPGGRRQRPDFAARLVDQLVRKLTVVALSEKEYAKTIQSAAHLQVAGGAIYDSLLLACARKIDADRIYTWNVRHFQMVAPDLKDRIVTP
jgi:predicted nucleic acid-binding protein